MENNRREFLKTALTLGSVAVLPINVSGKEMASPEGSKALPQLKGRKVLFVYGGWPGHEPEKWADYFVPWLISEGAEVQKFNTMDCYADKALMDTIDIVLQVVTMSKITREQEAGLLAAIEINGTAMAGWHGGMCDAFRDTTDYHFMTGGQFVSHPGGVMDYDVKIVDSSDEVTKGLKDFKMKSEQYYMHVDPNVKVLATTRFVPANQPEVKDQRRVSWIEGAVVPVTWKRMHGKGRVFYTSLGHNVSHLLDQPVAMEMLKRGVRWASASKYEPAEKWVSPVYGR